MLADLITWLVSFGKKLQSILYWFTDKLYDAALGLWNYIVDACCYAVELLYLSIDFNTDLFTGALNFAGLPTQMIYMFNAIGLQHVFVILTTAIMIRVGLNLIPGVLTRV